jgi:DNA-binding transcriptional ArsR family regulator
LRNRSVAYIFATIWFRYKKYMAVRRDIFQAIADPTRRAIIVLLAAEALTPNALAEHFDTTRQAVSKHLKVLAECELVRPKHDGREIYYELEVNKMKEIEKWLEQFRKIWEGRYKELDNVLLKLQNRKK